MASTSEDQTNREDPQKVKERMYRTKIIRFLGRSTPIILQNDNGPCPLLAICNILLLRDKLGLSSHVAEVSHRKLLTLVAERLIASLNNINKIDPRYDEKRHQSVADAIDLLPGIATGMDVNIKFRRIDDFEFTKECAVFGLLAIPLYHGWIVDPQDSETSNAIGSKSYDTLMGELVSMKNPEDEDDCAEHLGKEDIGEEHEPLIGLKVTKPVDPTSANSDGVNSSSRIRYNDDWVTFETNPGEDVRSEAETKDGTEKTSIEAVKEIETSNGYNNGSRIGHNIGEKTSNESCSSTPDVVLESSKDMTETNVDSSSVNSTSNGNEGELIKNFLKNNPSQLTTYGLFCLQNGLQEYELCVFFRNNHFNTMFKFRGQLYILITDQGYMNQPLVWEKLNEVDGNTMLVKENFKIFKPACHEIEEIDSSDEDNANLASVFEYLVRPDKTAEEASMSLSSDLHFDMNLQQQELKHVPPATFPSGFIVGPPREYSPWPRNPPTSSFRKQPKRSKQKCSLV